MAREVTSQRLQVNYFPSLESYDTNKNELTESHINLIPAQTVVETFSDGTNWYRVWSDGWIEQGGGLTWSATRNPGDQSVTFYKPMTTTSYNINLTPKAEPLGTYGLSVGYPTLTGFKFFVYGHGSDDAESTGACWYVCGY